MCECYRGGIAEMNVILASTVCKYDFSLRKDDLFVLS